MIKTLNGNRTPETYKNYKLVYIDTRVYSEIGWFALILTFINIYRFYII